MSWAVWTIVRAEVHVVQVHVHVHVHVLVGVHGHLKPAVEDELGSVDYGARRGAGGEMMQLAS